MDAKVLPISSQLSGRRGVMSLHVSKLRGISLETRSKLKHRGITYTQQLLEAAGKPEGRARLAHASGIEEDELLRLVRRADLARIKGIGAIFADMLELVDVDDVGLLAQQSPDALHVRLFELNASERLARRAPTPDEVVDWIRQARVLPRLFESREGAEPGRDRESL